MAASVREGTAAAAAAGHVVDDYDASDGEMDVDVEAGSELQHAGGADDDGRRDGEGDDEYALVGNDVPLGWCRGGVGGSADCFSESRI